MLGSSNIGSVFQVKQVYGTWDMFFCSYWIEQNLAIVYFWYNNTITHVAGQVEYIQTVKLMSYVRYKIGRCSCQNQNFKNLLEL